MWHNILDFTLHWILPAVVIYAFGMGATYGLINERLTARAGCTLKNHDECTHTGETLIATLIWPVSIVVGLALGFVWLVTSAGYLTTASSFRKRQAVRETKHNHQKYKQTMMDNRRYELERELHGVVHCRHHDCRREIRMDDEGLWYDVHDKNYPYQCKSYNSRIHQPPGELKAATNG